MCNPEELLQSLKESTIFRDWQKAHEKNYLTHFFSSISSQGELKSSWEIGFYSKATKKMTIFVQLPQSGFEIKPEDDVFKKPHEAIEPLTIDNVKISYKEALKIFLEKAPTEFPQEKLGDGFVIIQTVHKKTVWNFTFISKTLKFVNLKINAAEGIIVDKQVVELADKSRK